MPVVPDCMHVVVTEEGDEIRQGSALGVAAQVHVATVPTL